MIGKTRFGMDGAIAQPLAQRWRHHLVVDAPTHVVGARLAALRPPSVILAVRPQLAVTVHPVVDSDQAIEPRPLFRQAAGVFLVRGPVDRKSTRLNSSH